MPGSPSELQLDGKVVSGEYLMKVGLDVFQMPNGSILLKFKYYKQSVKAFIDIYMVQLRL